MRVFTDPSTPIPEVICFPTADTTSWSPARAAATAAGTTWPSRAGARTPRATAGDRSAICATWTAAPFWSAAWQPTLKRAKRYEAIFTQARAEFRRRDERLDTHTEISVSPEDDIELRRITITNRSDAPRTIEVTSYAEVVLAPPAHDSGCTRRSATCSCRRRSCATGRRSSARAGRGRPTSSRRGWST